MHEEAYTYVHVGMTIGWTKTMSEKTSKEVASPTSLLSSICICTNRRHHNYIPTVTILFPLCLLSLAHVTLHSLYIGPSWTSIHFYFSTIASGAHSRTQTYTYIVHMCARHRDISSYLLYNGTIRRRVRPRADMHRAVPWSPEVMPRS